MKIQPAEPKLRALENEPPIPVFTSQHAEYIAFVLKKQKAIHITELLGAFELEDRGFALSVVAAVFPELKLAIQALPEKKAKAKVSTKPEKKK